MVAMDIMNRDPNKLNFLKIIKSVILRKEIHIDDLDSFNLEKVIKYAKFHSLEYITYLGLKQLIIDEEQDIFKTFKKNETINCNRHAK